MSQVPVQWVDVDALYVSKEAIPDIKIVLSDFVPVVPLSALREVVDGLPDEFRQYERTLLEAHAGLTEEQLCGAAIALHWIKKRLLARLGEDKPIDNNSTNGGWRPSSL